MNNIDQNLEKADLYLHFKWMTISTIALIILAESYLGIISTMVLFWDLIGLIAAFAAGIFLWLNIGRLKPLANAIHFSLLVDLLVIVAVFHLGGGPESTWGFLPIVVVVVAGYLFGWRAAFVYAAVSFCSLALMFGLEYWHVLPHYSAFYFPIAYWHNVNYLGDYLLGLFLLHILTAATAGYYNHIVEKNAGALRQSTAEAVAARTDSEAARQLVTKAREELELRVIERTREVEDARRATLHMLKDLKEDMVKLEAVDRMKTEFMSMVSHELRTPLTPIRGYLSLLLDDKIGPLSDEQRKTLNIIIKQSNHLQELIESLLDLSRLELGKPIPIVKEPLSIKETFDDIIDSVRLQLDTRELKLEVEAGGDLPAIVADRVKLKRILSNLISNSLKFTPRGGEIRLSVRPKPGGIRIEVADNGIGIQSDLLEKVFERFYQIESAYTRETGGIGMGLTIARELVEMHGGRLWAESPGLGKGSIFIVELPFEGGRVNGS
jgi:signal transduction histidine kinase